MTALAAVEADFLPSSMEIVLAPGPDLSRRASDTAARLRRQEGIVAVDAMAEGLGRAAAFGALADRLARIVAVVALLAGLSLVAGLLLLERRRRRAEADTLGLLGATPVAMRLPAGALAALAACLGGLAGLPLGSRAADLLLGAAIAGATPRARDADRARLPGAGRPGGRLDLGPPPHRGHAMIGRPLLAAALALLLLGGPVAAQAPADEPLAEALARARTREAIGVQRSESAGARGPRPGPGRLPAGAQAGRHLPGRSARPGRAGPRARRRPVGAGARGAAKPPCCAPSSSVLRARPGRAWRAPRRRLRRRAHT